MTERICRGCGELLPADAFGKGRSQCRACLRLAAKRRRQADPERSREIVRASRQRLAERRATLALEPERSCTVCLAVKPIDAFARDKWAPSGRSTMCRPCHQERYRPTRSAWYARNHARTAEYVRRRNAKLADVTIGDVSPERIAQRMTMFGNRCWMCGGPFQHVDHVKPISKGGPHMLANLRPACQSCNNRKKDRWPLHWMPTRARTWKLGDVPETV